MENDKEETPDAFEQRMKDKATLRSKETDEDLTKNGLPSSPLAKSEIQNMTVREMIKHIDEMHDDLERQLKYIEDNIKYLPEEMQKYYKNPAAYIKDHNRLIEEYEKSLEEKMIALIGNSVVSGLEARKNKQQQQKKGTKAQRIRGRSKWISMD